MSTESIIKEVCLKYFDEVGFADAITPPSINFYSQWLDTGAHGAMDYLQRHKERKSDPAKLLKGCQSWIVLVLHYDTQEPLSIDLESSLKEEKKGWIARYARGRDYHSVIAEKLQAAIKIIKECFPREEFLACVDTMPVLERDTAHRAGLGWMGKNTCLIDQKRGSFFFIAEILTTLKLEPSRPQFDHCGTCTKCLDACPTGALEKPHFLNATKCISFWTIESKTPAPEDLAKKFGQNFFGCDICQDVCPWNHKARRTLSLLPAKESGQVPLEEFLKLSDEEIKERNKDSALNRAKPRHLKDNARAILKNSQRIT